MPLDIVIPSDYSGQLGYLLHYPTQTPAGASSSMTLLLQQAQQLQSSPSPATGVTVAMQNRDVLGISMEVPDPPSPPRRRGPANSAGRGRRIQSSSEASTLPNRQRSPLLGAGQSIQSKIGSYADQYRKDQFGLPELLSKGLSDINNTVYSTVTEIRVSRGLFLSHACQNSSECVYQ